MNSLAALALLAAAASDEKPLSWTEDLAAACEKAGREDKLVLLRQILCDCAERECAYGEAARNPAYLQDERAVRYVRSSFVPAVTHVAPGKEDKDLYHPGYATPDYRRGASRIRTLFLTPTRHIVHRLDLCPLAADTEAEFLFAVRAKRAAYAADGVPLPGSEELLFALHLEHARKPDSCHAQTTAPWSGLNPWKSVARGVAWMTELDEARAVAKKGGKPLLFFQVVGNLDVEGC